MPAAAQTDAGYPVGNNAATRPPRAAATAGPCNLTGRVERDGAVTIRAITPKAEWPLGHFFVLQ